MRKDISLILAATVPYMGIGKDGTLPWKLSREMKYFRQVTSGGIVIMGRRTWESIPRKFRPLSNRTNVVLSSSGNFDQLSDQCIAASSLDEALNKVANIPGKIFIIGGAKLYKSALDDPHTTRVLLTEITADIKCDSFFEDFPWVPRDQISKGWERTSFNELKEFVGPDVEIQEGSIEEKNLSYQFTMWKRTN